MTSPIGTNLLGRDVGYVGCPSELNRQNEDGKTALHLAFTDGDIAGIQELLGAGANVTITDKRGTPPAHCMFESKDLSVEQFSEILQMIRDIPVDLYDEQGSPIPLIDLQDRRGYTLLHSAYTKGKPEWVKVLLEKGAKVDRQNEDGETALHLAFTDGDITGIQELLGAGAKITIRDVWGTSPAHCMFQSEDLSAEQLSEILQVICDIPVDLYDEQGSPIPLIDLQDHRGFTLLHFACMEDKPEWVKVLLEKGAKVDLCDEEEGKTPLHTVFENSRDPAKIIEVFSETKTNVNTRDKDGMTPLHFACSVDKLEWVEPLLNAGVSPSLILQDKDDRTPLHYACAHNNKEMVKLLLEAGSSASLILQDKDGRTPLHYACANDNEEMVKMLKGAGAEASVNIQESEHGRTPLHYACAHDNKEMVRLLLEAGAEASVNLQETKDGRTPLHFAFAAGNAEIIQMLIFDAGASGEVQDHQGMLPSHCMLPTHCVLESKTPSAEKFSEVLQVISKVEGLIDLRGGRSCTLLHIASMHARDAANEDIKMKNLKRVAHLLAAGASIDIESKFIDIKRFLNENPQVIPMSEGRIDPHAHVSLRDYALELGRKLKGKSEEEVPS